MLKFDNGDNIRFTSDTHFWHKKILEYQINRGDVFDDISSMNEFLVKQWNETVSKDDIIFHLGDFSFGTKFKTEEIIKQLNGKIYLISGNHDFLKTSRFEKYFESIRHYREIKIGKQMIVLFHFPIYDWNNTSNGSWHLHGHTHNTYFGNGKIMDVGIDAHKELKPFTFNEISNIMSNKVVKKHYENDKEIS